MVWWGTETKLDPLRKHPRFIEAFDRQIIPWRFDLQCQKPDREGGNRLKWLRLIDVGMPGLPSLTVGL